MSPEQYMRQALELFAMDPPDTDTQRGYLEGLKTFAVEALGFRWDDPAIVAVSPEYCNMPFKRLPVCPCDPGDGDPPTKLERMKCKMRGGPCRQPNNEPQA